MKLRHSIYLTLLVVSLLTGVAVLLGQQQANVTGIIVGGGAVPKVAVADFRATGAAQPLMNVFNETLWNDLADSGVFEMVAKTFYPLEIPQSPTEFRPPSVGAGGTLVRNGPWLTDWSTSPVSSNYLAMGNAVAQGTDLRVNGFFLNVGQADVRTAQLIGNPYLGSLNEEGARRTAHQFAKDILTQMGATSLAGSKITFVSDRTGHQEIWTMDYDGSNVKQLTNYKSISKMPSVSPDGRRVALATMGRTRDGKSPAWQLKVHSMETGGSVSFYSPEASMLTTPEFSPDGKKLWFTVVLPGNDRQQLVSADVDGRNLTTVLGRDDINMSARLNPKNPSDVVFISGRTGTPQIWRMTNTGTGQKMLTDGTGDAVDPSWSPDGQKIAFAWTRGFSPGSFNIFVMDMASGQKVQLTNGNGRNESPWWAPDGNHLVFSIERGKSVQLYSMLANGTRIKQLTSQGNNSQPVWTKAGE